MNVVVGSAKMETAVSPRRNRSYSMICGYVRGMLLILTHCDSDPDLPWSDRRATGPLF